MTTTEIAAEHGVSRQSIHTYRRLGVFPQPVEGEGSTRPRFRADEVAVFFAANPKQPGKKRDPSPREPQGEPDMAEQTLTVGEPVASNDRGFLLYGGREIPTSYGHTIRVQESSAASGPHAWMFISDSPVTAGHDPHLSLDEAIAVHAALGQFIDGVVERWEDGAEMVEEARRRVLGEEGTGK